MPREQITHNPIISRELDGPSYPDGHPGEALRAIVHEEQARRNLHVSWNRDAQWVQAAIELTVADIRSILEHAIREATAAAKANEHIGEYDIEQHQTKVWSDTIDRAETNRAITALRRARDAAYGKDA